MGSSSYAPARNATHDGADDDMSSIRSRRALRVSRTESPGRADDDVLTEDELFAIWQAHLM